MGLFVDESQTPPLDVQRRDGTLDKGLERELERGRGEDRLRRFIKQFKISCGLALHHGKIISIERIETLFYWSIAANPAEEKGIFRNAPRLDSMPPSRLH
jgi:hypothetical protein